MSIPFEEYLMARKPPLAPVSISGGTYADAAGVHCQCGMLLRQETPAHVESGAILCMDCVNEWNRQESAGDGRPDMTKAMYHQRHYTDHALDRSNPYAP